MLHGLDHLTIVVADLAAAGKAFSDAGFHLTQRPDAPGYPTEKLLVFFGDGSYVELLAFLDEDHRRGHRIGPCLDLGQGFADYALRMTGIASEAARLDAAGISYKGPIDYHKKLTDGTPWHVRMLMPGRPLHSPVLPMLIEDVTDRSIRVAPPAERQHLGAARIAVLTVLTDSLEARLPLLTGLFGAALETNGHTAQAALGDTMVRFRPPARDEAGHFGRRGEGLYEIEIACADLHSERLLELCGGRLRLVPDSAGKAS